MEIPPTQPSGCDTAALHTHPPGRDPPRLTTGASNQTPAGPLNAIPDVIAFNEYFGWYNGTYDQFAGWIDSTHASIPTRAFGVSEFGAGASISQHQDNPSPPNPGGFWHPEEYQSLFHEAYWNALKTRPFVWEKTVWNMFDFAADARNEGDTMG